jgi:hypothetical protein
LERLADAAGLAKPTDGVAPEDAATPIVAALGDERYHGEMGSCSTCHATPSGTHRWPVCGSSRW